MLYSDNAAFRTLVLDVVGAAIGAEDRPIEWTEVATHQIAMAKCFEGEFDLIIMDNETSKLGGVGLIRQMRAELVWQPTVLLLLARQQDAWLAAWAGADAAMLQPVDPFELVTQVAELLGVPEA
jgi:DNA-binding response OmpR family regulator